MRTEAFGFVPHLVVAVSLTRRTWLRCSEAALRLRVWNSFWPACLECFSLGPRD